MEDIIQHIIYHAHISSALQWHCINKQLYKNNWLFTLLYDKWFSAIAKHHVHCFDAFKHAFLLSRLHKHSLFSRFTMDQLQQLTRLNLNYNQLTSLPPDI